MPACRAQPARLCDLAQLQSRVPDPLAEDLPEVLAVWRTGAPAIRVLFLILITQHLFEATPLVIQFNNLIGAQALGWSRGQKQFVDKPIRSFPVVTASARWGAACRATITRQVRARSGTGSNQSVM